MHYLSLRCLRTCSDALYETFTSALYFTRQARHHCNRLNSTYHYYADNNYTSEVRLSSVKEKTWSIQGLSLPLRLSRSG